MERLNFPYYFYPNIPFSGYLDTQEYNKNLVKLNDLFLTLMTINKKIIFHLTIGAAAEEILAEINDLKWQNQWKQLYPAYFDQSENEIVHIIVAPNKCFDEKNLFHEFKDPVFISFTSHLNWKKQNNFYKSSIKNITVYIFYTMMPTVDKKNKEKITKNTPKFKNISNGMIGEISNQYLIETYVQTKYDTYFTNVFYQNLNNLINHIKSNDGIAVCFSFAVFCKSTDKFLHGLNYNMFKEIKQLTFDFLGEWKFMCNCYELYNNITTNIKYDDNSIKIINDNNKLKLTFNL